VKPGVERPVNFRRLSRITVSGFTSLALRHEDTALLRALSSLDYNERRLGEADGWMSQVSEDELSVRTTNI